ncbi:patatin-like phospholipase family protein [Paenibacillus sp. IB182496]|uniref:Patatin-like phospholipase family protein n=1 Tax=Paenibacillus sabuli TaxID=2772509 RepID=A0A927GPV8_9BACL|nr:patatin-like phospholipase family protein [Paenibacillus sabuli]MBD2843631.1 patatin-like phospholipase family protein [Paenibacillus sabuli]
MSKKFLTYPIFSRLDAEDMEAILPYLSEHTYDAGTTLLRQGQAGDRLHLLLSGTLGVFVEKEMRVRVAVLEEGQICGEMSCLTGEPVSATVMAEGAVRTLSITRAGMLQLMERSPVFRKQMIEAMIARIGRSNERIAQEHARGALVLRQLERERAASFGPLVGSGPFMGQLRHRISRLTDSDYPLCLVGDPGVGKLHLAYAIHRGSARREQPLLRIDGAHFAHAEWKLQLRAGAGEGMLVLEHADHLPPELLHELLDEWSCERGRPALVMTACRRPATERRIACIELTPLRERVEDIPELAAEFLAQAGAVRPEEAIAEPAMRMLAMYPYMKGNIQELKEVVQQALVRSEGRAIQARHIKFGGRRAPGARPTIGLALGSGSVRGAAHIGVLKVLEREGIPVDIVAGTSVGAFLGALYVGGQPISAFERVLPTVRWNQLLRPALPPKAFFDNRPMARFVEKYIGPVQFDELPIPFAAVASDATTGEPYILNEGSVSHAICASTAIPGIMKPVHYRGRLLLDGAVVHPVPVALAKSLGADIVIAVDVSLPSFVKRRPAHFVSSILNTIDIMSEKIVSEELQLADVVLRPQLDTNQMTFKASTLLIQKGELAACEAVAAIRNKMS